MRTIKRSELRRGMEVAFINSPAQALLVKKSLDEKLAFVVFDNMTRGLERSVAKIHTARWPNETEWRQVVDDDAIRLECVIRGHRHKDCGFHRSTYEVLLCCTNCGRGEVFTLPVGQIAATVMICGNCCCEATFKVRNS